MQILNSSGCILDLYINGHAVESLSSQNFFIVSCSHSVIVLHFIEYYQNRFVYFSVICYQNFILNGVSVTPTSQICASVMLVLLIVGN
jgi:hypothetical protein